jgi:hypothetical protein
MLRHEYIRHDNWHKQIDAKAILKARRTGLARLRAEIRNRLQTAIGRPSNELWRDGTQTPKKGNVIYYGQHATATCCRKCVEEWYNIRMNRPLTQKEIDYLTQLIVGYIKERLPFLAEQGEKKGSPTPAKAASAVRK